MSFHFLTKLSSARLGQSIILGVVLGFTACSTANESETSAEAQANSEAQSSQPVRSTKESMMSPSRPAKPKAKPASAKSPSRISIDHTRPYWVTAPQITMYSTTRSIVGRLAFGTKLTIYDSKGVFLKIDPVQDHWIMSHQISDQEPQMNVGPHGLDKIPERNNMGWVDPKALENGRRE